MLEGLVSADPSTGEAVPALASSWRRSEDGLTYTFDLRENVRFHDGTDLDAAAVCANFERWEALSADGARTPFAVVFRTAAPGTDSLYAGCAATSATPTAFSGSTMSEKKMAASTP